MASAERGVWAGGAPITKQMKSNPNLLLGALAQLDKFLDNHSATLTEKGQNPAALKAALALCIAAVLTAKQGQEDAKTTLKSATASVNDAISVCYPEFSSAIDLLRGVVGNKSPLGKQLTNIRKLVTKRSSRSSGTDTSKAA